MDKLNYILEIDYKRNVIKFMVINSPKFQNGG